MIQIKYKVKCVAIDPILLKVKVQAKAKALTAYKDDSCCGCFCCESSSPQGPVDEPISSIQFPDILNH